MTTYREGSTLIVKFMVSEARAGIHKTSLIVLQGNKFLK